MKNRPDHTKPYRAARGPLRNPDVVHTAVPTGRTFIARIRVSDDRDGPADGMSYGSRAYDPSERDDVDAWPEASGWLGECAR